MREEVDAPLEPYSLLLTESYGPVYESITRNLPLIERTSLRLVDRTIGDLVSRKYEFILDCIKKYEDYIRNHELSESDITEWELVIDPKYHTHEDRIIYYPSLEELRFQLREPHFSWLAFLYCYRTMSLSKEQLEELSSALLHGDTVRIMVTIGEIARYDDYEGSRYFSKSEHHIYQEQDKHLLYKGYSPRYLVLFILIRENIDNLDGIDKDLFGILVKDLAIYELESLARYIIDLNIDLNGFDTDDNSYVFQYLSASIDLPSPSEDRFYSFIPVDIPSVYRDNGDEIQIPGEDLEYMLMNIYAVWMNSTNVNVDLKYGT